MSASDHEHKRYVERCLALLAAATGTREEHACRNVDVDDAREVAVRAGDLAQLLGDARAEGDAATYEQGYFHGRAEGLQGAGFLRPPGPDDPDPDVEPFEPDEDDGYHVAKALQSNHHGAWVAHCARHAQGPFCWGRLRWHGPASDGAVLCEGHFAESEGLGWLPPRASKEGT